MNQQKRVRLAPLVRDDAAAMFEWINARDEVLHNAAYKPVHQASHERWFEAIQQRSDLFIFGIRLIDGDRLIGSCQLMNIDPLHRSAETQIRIGDISLRGGGIGTEALDALLDFGFRDLNLNRVCARVFDGNQASRRAHEKAGFRLEGTLREAAHIDGRYVDVSVLAILRAERDG